MSASACIYMKVIFFATTTWPRSTSSGKHAQTPRPQQHTDDNKPSVDNDKMSVLIYVLSQNKKGPKTTRWRGRGRKQRNKWLGLESMGGNTRFRMHHGVFTNGLLVPLSSSSDPNTTKRAVRAQRASSQKRVLCELGKTHPPTHSLTFI